MTDETRDPLEGLYHRRTREDWLLDAFEAMRGWFADLGHKLPEMVRISVGFRDGAKQESKIVVGCTYPGEWTDDKIYQVYISPVTADPVLVLDTLVHELVHVILECKSGHDRPFKKIAQEIGLVGKMAESEAGPELRDRLTLLGIELGPYPHSALHVPVRSRTRQPVTPDGDTLGDPRPSGPRRQSNRQLKTMCMVDDCEARDGNDRYIVRTSRRWIDRGLPRCPAGHEMVEVD